MGERGKGVGAEVLFSRRWECLTLVHLTPFFLTAGGQVKKKPGGALPDHPFKKNGGPV